MSEREARLPDREVEGLLMGVICGYTDIWITGRTDIWCSGKAHPRCHVADGYHQTHVQIPAWWLTTVSPITMTGS